jgi:inorganic triphosphatase YgiF
MEIELKLALPGTDAAGLARRLGRLPLLARRKPLRQALHNIYYDTPDQLLRGMQVALRVRSLPGPTGPAWRQTLKMGAGDSALSQRGEWETDLPGARLSRAALADTPWQDIDPDGRLFQALAPRFETRFERTIWLVRRRDRSQVEIALDIGSIMAGGRSTPILELEFELRAGPPEALFEVARQFAQAIAVLPLGASKAERGHALADGKPDLPRRAQPGAPTRKRTLRDIARSVLLENFGQFCTNLELLRRSSAPELAHQARVGWRRFRSSIRLFGPFLAMPSAPSWVPLRALLIPLGELRDLDVARSETLPPLAPAFAAGSRQRAARWTAMLKTLDDQAQQRLEAVRTALGEPAVGACLLATTEWLELRRAAATDDNQDEAKAERAPRRWALRKLARLQRRMKDAAQDRTDLERQHRSRILAKRLRYGVEDLRSLLPRRQAERWHEQASGLQSGLGAERDLAQALQLARRLELDPGVADYLLGVAAGQGDRLLGVPSPVQRAKPGTR